MKTFVLCTALAIAALTSGCASIINEQTQRINVSASNSKPLQGTIDGIPFTGPGVVSVRREKAAKIINVDTAGCARQTSVENQVDLVFFANIFIPLGTLGSSTDLGSGKMWRYTQNVIIACNP